MLVLCQQWCYKNEQDTIGETARVKKKKFLGDKMTGKERIVKLPLDSGKVSCKEMENQQSC